MKVSHQSHVPIANQMLCISVVFFQNILLKFKKTQTIILYLSRIGVNPFGVNIWEHWQILSTKYNYFKHK